MKRLLLLFFIAATTLSAAEAQVQRELKTEDNGFKWYQTHSGSYYGAESTDGRTIIPLSKQYTMVVFHEKKDCIGYFGVYRNGKKGAYDIHGNLVIEPVYENLYYLSQGFSYEDAYGTDHYLGITLDASGRASSASGTSTASTAYSSTSSSSSTSPRTFDFYFLYLYDVMSEKNKLPKDCDKSPSPNSDLCTALNNFVMRYELYDTYFKVSIIATNLGTKKEDAVEQHRIYPKEAEMLTANGGYTIVWGNTNNLTIRENKSMLTLLDGDVKKQKVLSCDTTKNVNRILRTAYKAVDCTTVKLEDQYSAKYSQLVSYLRRYSWKATGAAD